jgi:hypothetical protein
MWRRRFSSGLLSVCAMGALTLAVAGASADEPGKYFGTGRAESAVVRTYDRGRINELIRPVAAQDPAGWRRAREPEYRRPGVTEFRIPAGHTYTAIVITPGRSSGALRLNICSSRGSVPVLVPCDSSYTIPFQNGWRIDGEASISSESCDGPVDFQAWGVSECGPIPFERCRN